MADTQVLGTCVFGRAGSSPASRTSISKGLKESNGAISCVTQMAKPSRAKVKKLQSEAMKAAAARRAEKAASKSEVREVVEDPYAAVDQEWVALGISAPARRALIDEGYYSLPDLRKASLKALKEVRGIGPNVIRILVAEMKKQDIQFRSN